MYTAMTFDFKNDVLFKFLLANDQDPDCYYLLKLIIEQLCHLHCQIITVKNPDLNPQIIEDKDMILDIRIHDELGRIYNIEMQNSNLTKVQYQRFQIYSSRIVADQEGIGQKYQVLHPVYQIIFIDDMDEEVTSLVDEYQSRNIHGKIERYNLLTRIYVYLPYINIVKEKKGLKQFNELEKAIYIFKNGIDNDIMEMKDKVVKIMSEKAEYFNNDKELRELAFKRAINRQAWNSEVRNAKIEGIIEGKEEGKVEGELQAKYQTIVKLYSHYFPHTNTSILEGLTNEQYDTIFDMLLDNASLQSINDYIIKRAERGK